MIDLGINKLFIEAGAYGWTLKRKVKRNVKDKAMKAWNTRAGDPAKEEDDA